METAERTVLVAQPEAARLLGVERTTIWRMCRRGDLQLVHIGRRALVTRASLDAFVDSQCAPASSPSSSSSSVPA